MKRAGVRRLRRNLAVAIGNAGGQDAIEFLTSRGEPTCSDPLVAEHVAWAVEKLRG
jgi:epoxyqueuosine reductase QueG